MKKYHYEIFINFEKLENTAFSHVELSNPCYLDTNNKLEKDELLTIKTLDNALIRLEITKITRYMFYADDRNLVEMDMSYSFYQENRPVNTTDEVWYECHANALSITD